MKIQIILILFILFSFGCKNSPDSGIFMIKFDIQDTTRTEIAVDYKNDMGLSGVTKYIPVKSKDSTNCIIDNIKQPFIAYINIDEIEFPIWVEPNSGINIVFAKDTIIFSGEGKIYGDYYLKAKDYWFKIYHEYERRNPVLQGRPEGFKYFNVQDSITIDRMNFLESFFVNQKSSSAKQFIEKEKSNLFYTDIFYKISGLTSLNDFSFYQNAKNQPSDTFLRFTDEFEFNNPDLFHIAQFRRCYEWLPYEYLESNGLDYHKNIEEAYDFILSLSQNTLCRKYMEVIFLNKLIEDSKETQDYSLNSLIEKRFALLENDKKDIETYLNILHKKHVELLESEKKSKEYISLLENEDYSKGIKLRDLSSNKNAEFLKTIIQQYPGKILYVDVWAPWCGPCMKEMVYSNEMQKKYKDKNIEFIFLGVSCNNDVWKSTIARRKLTGEHYFLADEQKDELFKMFEFSGIPRYLIIDKKGIVVNSNAPVPSNVEKLEEIFSKMLE